MLPPFARRAPSPLVPRPAVLPCPAEMPRPTRFLCFLLPGAGCRSCNFIAYILVKTYGVFCNRTRNTPSGLHLFHLHQMPDLRQHAAQLRRVGLFHGLVQATEAKRGHGGLVLLGVPQWAAHQGTSRGQIPLPWLESNDALPLATRMETRLPWHPTRGSLTSPSYLVRNRTLRPLLENHPETPPSSRDDGLRPLHGLATNRAPCL